MNSHHGSLSPGHLRAVPNCSPAVMISVYPSGCVCPGCSRTRLARNARARNQREVVSGEQRVDTNRSVNQSAGLLLRVVIPAFLSSLFSLSNDSASCSRLRLPAAHWHALLELQSTAPFKAKVARSVQKCSQHIFPPVLERVESSCFVVGARERSCPHLR